MIRAPAKRASVIVVVALVSAAGACNFGVDLEGIFGQPGPVDGSPDTVAPDDGGGGEDVTTVPKVAVAQLAVGPESACARRVDGTVMCWGNQGADGRLGDGSLFPTAAPVLVKDVSDAIDVAVGANHACAVRGSGTVVCWGDNQQRQIGDGTTNTATVPRAEVITLTDAQSVAVGSSFSCAVRKDGSVHCWGSGANGELGDGQRAGRSQPMPVKGVTGATQVVALQSGACALAAAGEVFCWGIEPTTGTARLEPVKIAGLTDVASLGGGAASSHTCAVTKTGGVQCWGVGNSGQLGDGKNAHAVDAVPVAALRDATSVATGNAFTCATLAEGQRVSCWGTNNWRQLGVGDVAAPASASTPLPVVELAGAKAVAAGGAFACALSQDGMKIWCWGNNYFGTLGRATRVIATSPARVSTATPVTDMALGQNHGCALGPDGIAACWGRNDHTQLAIVGLPVTGTPTPLGDAGGFARVFAGDEHTCVLSGDVLRCLGRGTEGQFGNGGQADSVDLQPFGVAATDAFVAGNATCVRVASGELQCAGQNNVGQLGAPAGGNILTPVAVRGPAVLDGGGTPPATLAPVDAVVAGRSHACGLLGGTLYCWGAKNEGQCGPGGQSNEVPQEVPLPAKATQFALGSVHTCAVLENGSVQCWGNNQWGQLSGVEASGTALRTPDFGGKLAKGIAAGDAHTCALMEDETVTCWGQGTYGQLGGGLRADANRPMPVSNLSKVKSIYARSAQSCALVVDGSLWCWGVNWFGQLGDGAVMLTGIPGAVVGYE